MSSLAREGLAALSGVLLVLSFPKFGNGAVAFVALVPLLSALPGTAGLTAFRLGYVTGAVSSLGLLYWTALVVTQFGGLSLAVSAAIMTLLCLAVALFPALFAWTVAAWVRRLGTVALLLAPLAWVATEVLRAYTVFRFPWCLLGYSQHAWPALIQVASVTAVYGVSFLLVAVSSALAFARLAGPGRARAAAIAGALGLVGAAWAFGEWRLAQPLPEHGSVRVGLVQASIRQDQKWRPDLLAENLERHVRLTRRAAARGARLVVWPESAVPYLYDEDPAVALALGGLARELGVALAFGNDDREGGEGARGRVFVGAKAIDSEGRLTLRYRKLRLVPFGEYVPLQPLLTLGGRVTAKLVQQVSDFTPGEEAVVGQAGPARAGMFICYEAIFPDLVRRFTAGGAELLLNVTNDGWYGTTSAPYQHFAMTVFRAVENGRYLARAANTGISGVVDPRGRVLARTALFEQTALVTDVPLVGGETFYVRHGDLFAWGCLALALCLSMAAARAR